MTPEAALPVLLARYKRVPRGLAAIEMVLVTPVLLLMLLGVAEITNAFVQYNTLVKSTQAAARYIANHATPGNTNLINLTEEAIANAKQVLIYGTTADGANPLLGGLAADSISVIAVDATHVGVTASFAYQPLFAGGIPGFFGETIDSNFTLTASSVMRAL